MKKEYENEEKLKGSALNLIKENEKQKMCTIKELESDIFNIEGVRVVFRTNINNLVPKYPFKKRCKDSMSLKSFIHYRIKSTIDNAYDFTIINGYKSKRALETVGEVRKSYIKE